MRLADRIAGALLLACGVAFSAAALKFYPYWGPNGPGAGFLPFWLGLAMAVLAAIQLVAAVRSREPGEDWLPEAAGRKRIAVVMCVTVAFVALLKVLGMIAGTAIFLVVLLRWLGGVAWPLTLVVSGATAGLIYLVFSYWLRVPFPVSVFGF